MLIICGFRPSPAAVFLTNPDNALPGPISMKRSAPALSSASTSASNLTLQDTWFLSSSGINSSAPKIVPVTFIATGMTGLLKLTDLKYSYSLSPAPSRYLV